MSRGAARTAARTARAWDVAAVDRGDGLCFTRYGGRRLAPTLEAAGEILDLYAGGEDLRDLALHDSARGRAARSVLDQLAGAISEARNASRALVDGHAWVMAEEVAS